MTETARELRDRDGAWADALDRSTWAGGGYRVSQTLALSEIAYQLERIANALEGDGFTERAARAIYTAPLRAEDGGRGTT